MDAGGVCTLSCDRLQSASDHPRHATYSYSRSYQFVRSDEFKLSANTPGKSASTAPVTAQND